MERTKKILVVDDEAGIRNLLEVVISALSRPDEDRREDASSG